MSKQLVLEWVGDQLWVNLINDGQVEKGVYLEQSEIRATVHGMILGLMADGKKEEEKGE